MTINMFEGLTLQQAIAVHESISGEYEDEKHKKEAYVAFHDYLRSLQAEDALNIQFGYEKALLLIKELGASQVESYGNRIIATFPDFCLPNANNPIGAKIQIDFERTNESLAFYGPGPQVRAWDGEGAKMLKCVDGENLKPILKFLFGNKCKALL